MSLKRLGFAPLPPVFCWCCFGMCWPAIPLTDIYKKDVLTYFKAIPLTQDKEDVLKHVGIDLHITNMVNAAINDNGELVREAKLAVCERDLEKKAAEDLCEKWKKE